MRVSHLAIIAAVLLGGCVAPGSDRVYVEDRGPSADVAVSVNEAPPPLPVYEQPPIPGPGYIWTPGYWAWSREERGYYWVPGTWAEAPQPGYLWTPPYWGWDNGVYLFHTGYWGPHVGFYGGVSYGYGYGGHGYDGGYWRGNNFYYNRTVNNVRNVNITNVYEKTVIVNRTTNVSYNGGPGGLKARPTAVEVSAKNDRHVEPTPAQINHQRSAGADRDALASHNGGKPKTPATARPVPPVPGRPVAPAKDKPDGNVSSYKPPVGTGAGRRGPNDRGPAAGHGYKPVPTHGGKGAPPPATIKRPLPVNSPAHKPVPATAPVKKAPVPPHPAKGKDEHDKKKGDNANSDR